jgi:hypothetical protein
MLITHIPLMPSLRMSGARPPLSHTHHGLYRDSSTLPLTIRKRVSRVARLQSHSYIAPYTRCSVLLYYISYVLITFWCCGYERRECATLHAFMACTGTNFNLVEALRYRPEGRRFDSQWGQWHFSFT